MFSVTWLSELNDQPSLIYWPEEHNFDTVPHNDVGFTSLLVNDLQLELGENGRIIAVWGLCAQTTWKSAALSAPVAPPGEVRFNDPANLVPGIAIRLNPRRSWPVLFDRQSGWVCIDSSQATACAVTVMTGVIVEIDGAGCLVRLWLHPK